MGQGNISGIHDNRAETFTTYVGNFNTTFTSILTSRLLLDIYEIEARLPRGGASATGSFSINVQVNSAEPGESLEFVTSYGGRAHSGPFSEDRDDDAIGLEEEGEETSSVPADGAIREETAFSRRSLSGRTPPQETKGKARALAK
ncbi:hypothetical protein C8Q77DRAFT_827120 [Trametes polyzona]|nr:hypothetical protein C8Q77DRAFT_827120 [Trametes polyzona]